MVDYWLDSNVLIAGRDGPYAFDLAPQFWTILEAMSEAGLLACPRTVYDELLGHPDDLANWAREREKAGMFPYPNAAVQREFERVCTYTIGALP